MNTRLSKSVGFAGGIALTMILCLKAFAIPPNPDQKDDYDEWKARARQEAETRNAIREQNQKLDNDYKEPEPVFKQDLTPPAFTAVPAKPAIKGNSVDICIIAKDSDSGIDNVKIMIRPKGGTFTTVDMIRNDNAGRYEHTVFYEEEYKNGFEYQFVAVDNKGNTASFPLKPFLFTYSQPAKKGSSKTIGIVIFLAILGSLGYLAFRPKPKKSPSRPAKKTMK